MGLDGQTIRSDPLAGLWETKIGTSFDILDNKALDRFDKPFLSQSTPWLANNYPASRRFLHTCCHLVFFEKQSSLGRFSLATDGPILTVRPGSI
jgi:hypothetical protein